MHSLVMNILITGGAGFIASHLADSLAEKDELIIIDDLSNGNVKNVNKKSRLIKKNLMNESIANELKNIETVFHFAADPEVKSSAEEPKHGFENNAVVTFRLLEDCRKFNVKNFVFASTSTVYGDAEVVPTPEIQNPEPISNYGASKLACEAYCSSYANCYGIKTTVLRYANIFGERSNHGVMFDFFQKLKRNSEELEILGNGKQEKSYLHIQDCITATLLAFNKQNKIFDIYNVGSEVRYDVTQVAKLVCSILKLSPKFKYTGGDRGWKGDVKIMQLAINKIKKLGWKQNISFEEGIKRYINYLGKL